METDEDTFVVGSVASNSPEFHELTLTSVKTGETVAMGQSLSKLVDSFCYYLKGTIMIFQKSIFIILSKITLMSIRRNTWRKKRQQQSN